MEQSVEEAWAQARAVFNHGTLRLTGAELRQTRDRARPFVKLVAGRFIDGLGDRVLREEARADHITLQVKGWASELVLRYPTSTPDAKRTTRQFFDRFHMRLPTGDARLELRFALGEGDTRREAWDVIQWGLFSWGTRERIDRKAAPLLRAIKERLPDLQLDLRESTIPPPGSSAQLARIVEYTEFGADVQASAGMAAADLRRLLEAAQDYQDP
jgi:hypothetical protein